ncbi:MAG: helix-turn-helix transcriptional regulator [Bacteroidetes bacterium]|nr:helix-turn-helix transcriptional regulator [Bacteroidota bacterium]
MRKIKIPRIIKLNGADENLTVSVVFNNGERRLIDFKNILNQMGVNPESPTGILFDQKEFKKVKLVGNTLSWDNVEQFISSKNGELIKVPFEIGADILLKFSTPEKLDSSAKIGELIRKTRIKSGMSQQELALVSGTSRTYISRVENDRSDIELATLRKIIETGLGKKMEILIR